MRILLINPWTDDYLPPPAIGYLQAACKHWGADVKIANLAQAMILKDTFDLVGVTFHSFSVKYARQLRDKFRGHLICGGHHPSAMPEQMLAIGYNQVVQGEGENAIISILQGNKERIVRNCDHQYFNGINDIPFPDYSGISFSGEIGISIITSRGCPFRCNFCASTDFWGHKYFMRSAENVLSEIDKRKSEGYKTWIFEDDNFLVNEKRAYDICSQLDGSYVWQCQARAESLTKDLCAELFRAGCRKVWVGVESLSQNSLDRCEKNTSVERMLSGIANASNAGIATMALFLVGLPGNITMDIDITCARIKDSQITERGVNIAWILPNTEIYRKAKERGFDDNIYLESGAPFYTYEQSMETLRNWEQKIMTA